MGFSGSVNGTTKKPRVFGILVFANVNGPIEEIMFLLMLSKVPRSTVCLSLGFIVCFNH